MRNVRRLSAFAVAALASVVLASLACTSTPPPVSVHNLERPSDIAFACVGLLSPGGGADGGADAGADSGADAGADGDAGPDAGGLPTVSGRPMYECNKPGQFDPPFDVTRRTFAFIANSARGELSVLDLDNSKLIDLDLANPETNVAPLGVLPEQMSASNDGCRIVTANRGSCDLTLVDIPTLMTPELALEGKVTVPSTGPSTVSQEIVVRRVVNGVPDKPLRLNPQEIMFLPQDTSAILKTANLCERGLPHADPIGWNPTPGQPVETQWKALVTYPTCNLVALVDLPTGNIVDSMKINPGSDGVSIALESTGTNPDCPVEDSCDGRAAPPVAGPDGGGADAGAEGGSTADASAPPATAVSSDPFVNPNGTAPSSMAILPTGERVYVGLTQASFVAAIDVQPNHLAIPSTGGGIKLHESALGANAVRLSVDPFQGTSSPGQLGGFVGQGSSRQRQYLYVVARDGTVRVVDVSPRTQLLPETECDVNVDPRFVPIASSDPLVPDRSDVCWPTEPPDFAHRRPLVRGPGINLPSIPRDVTFADLTTGNQEEIVLDGSYAFILTGSGAVYEVNIAPTLRTLQVLNSVASPAPLQEVQPLVNSLRDENMITFNSSLDPTVGPARVDVAPTPPPLGPQISAINTTSPDDNATNITFTTLPTYIFFPQQICTRTSTMPPAGASCDSALPMIQPQRQTWNVAWEGNIFGPSFSGQLNLDPTTNVLTLKDAGVDFCQAGALPGDFVTLFGCTVDTQCGPDEICGHSPTAPDTADGIPINGMCVPNNNASAMQNQRLMDCAPLLNSLRRYDIVDAKSTSNTPSTLTLVPKLDEIASGTIGICRTAAPPKAGVPAMNGNPATADTPPIGCTPSSYGTQSTFSCLDVDGSSQLRCVEICSQDSDCRSGRTCVTYGNGTAPLFKSDQKGPLRFCAEGAPLTTDLVQKCELDQLAAYQVGAGNSFLVQGTAPAPFVPGIVDPTTFSCLPNPERLDRISYFQTVNGVRTSIPKCTNVNADMPIETTQPADDIQGILLKIIHETPTPNPCLIRSTTASSAPQPPAPIPLDAPYRVVFQNREIRFMLVGFESQAAFGDPITFDVHGGFLPDQVVIPTTIDINTPNRIVVGPQDSQTQVADLSATHELPFMFVIDQRRLGSIAAGVGATRGQILRINPRRATTTDTSSLVPIYDDPVSTNNLWPIQ